MNSTRISRWTPIVTMAKDLVQILAIVIGGLWVLFTFGLSECYEHDPNIAMKSEISWSGYTKETCTATWYVTAENLGARGVDIDHGTVAVWPFAAPSGDKHVVYVDLDALRAQGNKPWTISDGKAASAFFAHYAPKAGRYHTFEWVFRQPAAPQSAAFELKLYRKGDPVDKPVAYVHQWATLCPPQSPPPSTSSTAQ